MNLWAIVTLSILFTSCTALINPTDNIELDQFAYCGNDVECVIDGVNIFSPECDNYEEYDEVDLRALRDAGKLHLYEMWAVWIIPGILGWARGDDEDKDRSVDWAEVYYIQTTNNAILTHELMHVKGPCKERWF